MELNRGERKEERGKDGRERGRKRKERGRKREGKGYPTSLENNGSLYIPLRPKSKTLV